ncbi:MAG: DUF805 domain-containing protein [Dehalococcoidia bacterium]|nr:DUF805 domain-containing protein [Dehalococcoidia bacterium]
MGGLFTFDGRRARGGWLLAFLIANLISLTIILIPVSLWIYFATSAQRWHDIGQSGWWSLITFVPLVGSLAMLIIMVFISGQAGNNGYGLYSDRR